VKLSLADALGAAQRFEEARSLLRTLVEAFGGRRPKERAPVHFYLARLDLALGDRARALVELDAATKIDPANAEILRALAELARDDGQLDRSERSYDTRSMPMRWGRCSVLRVRKLWCNPSTPISSVASIVLPCFESTRAPRHQCKNLG
jgi:Tfp pilus assembly protein PilF